MQRGPYQSRASHALTLGNSLQVKGELATVTKTDSEKDSFARVNFHSECEAAINEQIK
jgi:hypothetical protein